MATDPSKTTLKKIRPVAVRRDNDGRFGLKLKVSGLTIRVTSVAEAGAANAAGLKVGDVVVSLKGVSEQLLSDFGLFCTRLRTLVAGCKV
jgi:predicted metalloprotease with PDZ domain